MRNRPAIVLLLFALGLAAYEGRAVVRRWREAQTLQTEFAAQEVRRQSLAAEETRLAAELASTQAQLAGLQAQESSRSNAVAVELKSWFQRLDRLKGIFADHP